MKNPLMDAIKNLKAKRIAVIVGDADELGLEDQMPGAEMQMQAQQKPMGEPEEEGDVPIQEDAEAVLGRKPFAGAGMSDDEDEFTGDDGGEDYLGGKKPKSFLDRAQMKMKKKFGM